jgi:hypothetical protein
LGRSKSRLDVDLLDRLVGGLTIGVKTLARGLGGAEDGEIFSATLSSVGDEEGAASERGEDIDSLVGVAVSNDLKINMGISGASGSMRHTQSHPPPTMPSAYAWTFSSSSL